MDRVFFLRIKDNLSKFSNKKVLFLLSSALGCLLFFIIAVVATIAAFSPQTISTQLKQLPFISQANQVTEVLQAATQAKKTTSQQGEISFNLPAIFTEDVLIDANYATVSGTLTAPNILYGLVAGENITISGGQNPTISASTGGVLSFQGQIGDVQLTQGDGITLDGTTITNSDPGSSQNIFSTIQVGSSTITAENNTDTFELIAGTGITLSANTGDKTITITNSGTSGGGGSSAIILQEGDTTKSAAATTIDFLGGDFDVTEAPSGEGNVQLASTLTSVVGVAGAFATGTTLTVGSTFTMGGDTFSDLTGSGLTVSGGSLNINLTTSGTTGSSSSNSGLEVSAGGLTLLKGCGDNEILKYTDASGWACAADAGAGGSGIATVQSNDSTVGSTFDTLDFSSLFAVTALPATEANVTIAADALNFTELSDSLTLDAATTITNPTAGDLTIDLTSTGDFVIADSSTPFFTFTDSGALTQVGAGQVTFTGNVDATNGLDVTSANLTVGGTNIVLNAATGAITATGAISGSNFSGNSTGTNTGDQTITLTGDVSGSGTGSFLTTIQPDAVVLGTDTSGAYVATIGGNSQVGVSGSGAETAGVTLSIVGDSIGDGQLTFDTGQSLTSGSSPTFNGLTIASLTRGTDTITDFTGTGLQVTGNSLETTLGTSVDLASAEITGVLALANGGTGLNITGSSIADGQLLIGSNSGDGFGLATLTAGSGITITNGSGAITISQNASGASKWTLSGNVLYPNALNQQVGIGTQTESSVISSLYVTRDLSSGALGKALGIFNQTESQDLLTASAAGVTKFTVANDGTITTAGGLTATGAISGSNFSGASSGTNTGDQTITLTGDVSGSGTGSFLTTIQPDAVVLGTDTTGAYLSTLTGNGQISVSGSGGETATVSLAIVGNSIGDSQLAFNTGQDLTSTSTPVFNTLALTSLIISGDTISDFAGTGLQVTGNTLETTLGTSVDLASAEITGVLSSTNGGTGANLSTSVQGSVPYFSSTGVMSTLAPGTAGYVLTTNGSGADPTWTPVGGLSNNFWDQLNGVLTPKNESLDLLIGAQSTASAKFAVLNINSGTPVASISAGSGNGAAFLTGAGNLGTVNSQTLTIGGSGTGNIIIDSGTGLINLVDNTLLSGNFTQTGATTFTTGTGQVTLAGNVDALNGLDVTNAFTVSGAAAGKALAILNETGDQNILSASASGATAMILDRSGNLSLYSTTANSDRLTFSPHSGGLNTFTGTFTSNDLTGNQSWNFPDASGDVCLTSGNCAGVGGNGDITAVGSVNSGAAFANASADDQWLGMGATSGRIEFDDQAVDEVNILAAKLGLGTQTPASLLHVSGAITGQALVTLDELGDQDIFTASASGVTRLTLSNTGNLNLTGGVYQANGTSGITVASASCVTAVNGIVVGQNTCPSAASSFIWNTGSGSIFEGNITQDLLIGGQATASAKFAVLNVNSGTPTASLSGGLAGGAYLTANGTLQTTANQTLTVGGLTTGNIIIDSGTGLITLNDNTTISQDLTVAGGDIFGANGESIDIGEADNGSIIFSASGETNNNNLEIDLESNIYPTLTSGASVIGIDADLQFVGDQILTSTGDLSINATDDIVLSDFNDCAALTTVGTALTCGTGAAYSNWNVMNGTIQPKLATTLDLLVGGTTTSSAKFAFINVASGVPSASISAGTANNNTFLTGAGNLGTTNMQTLTVGGASTGNIIIDSGSSLISLVDATTLSGNFTQTGVTTFTTGTGLTTISGPLTVNGNATFGDAITDTLTFTGRVAQDADLIPIGTAGVNDLGTTLLPWDNLYVGDITQNGTTLNSTYAPIGANFVTITANGTLTGSAGIDALTTAISTTNNLNVDGTTTLAGVTLDANANLILAAGTGKLGIGTASPLATLDVRGNSGTTPIASFSGQSAFAALLVDNRGTGDIFTASTGGVPKFTVQNNGTLVDSAYTTAGGIFYGTSTGAISLSTAGVAGQVLQSNGSGAPTWVSTSAINYWDLVNNALSPKFATVTDLLLGSNATASAKFAVLNMNSGTPTASISAVGNGGLGLTLVADGTIQALQNGTLTFGGATTGNMIFNPLNGAGFSNFNGTVGINTANPLATLDLRGNSGTSNIASFSGNTSVAGLLVDNRGTGDIFTASSSGLSRFVVKQNGTVGIGTTLPTATLDVVGTASVASALTFRTGASAIQTTANNTLTFGGSTTGNIIVNPLNGLSGGFVGPLTNNVTDLGTSTIAFRNIFAASDIRVGGSSVCLQSGTNCPSAGVNYWDEGNGALFPKIASVHDLLIGGQSSASAKFGFINVNSGTPTASISANNGANNTFLTGAGNLGTTNMQTLTVGGASTGNIVLSGRSGTSNSIYFQGYFCNGSNNGKLTVDATGLVQCADDISSLGAGTLAIEEGGSGVVSGATIINFAASDFNVSLVPTTQGDVAIDYANSGITRRNNAEVIGGQWSFLSDILAGGTSTASARFGVLNMQGTGTPTASLSGGLSGGTFLTASGQLQTTANQTLTFGGATTGNLVFNPLNGSGFSNFNGKMGINTSNPLAALDVRGISGTLPVSSLSGQTAFATLMVDNSGLGDIFTASASGTSRFTIGQNGSITTNGSTGQTLGTASCVTTTNGIVTGSSACATSPSNFIWNTGSGAIFEGNITQDLLIGGQSTASAKFAILNVNSGTPIASVSGANGAAFLAATGNLATTNMQTLTVGGTSTGNIVIDSGTSLITLADPTTLSSTLTVTSTTTFSALGQGIAHLSSGGVLSSSALNLAGGALEVIGILPVSNGGSPFDQGSGAIFERNITQDFLLGSQASASAKFAVLNVNSGTPIASVSATATGLGLAMSGDGSLQSLRNSTLTLGGLTTGNIVLNPLNGAGDVRINGTTTLNGLTYTWPSSQSNANGFVLQTNGSGGLTWTDPQSLSSSLWDRANGALFPKIASVHDLLLGSNATSSAKFAVTGINGGATPFASVSATTASGGNGNGITLGGDSTIQSLQMSTLTIGGASTGHIVIDSGSNVTQFNDATLTTNQTALNLFNTTATNISFAGAATTLSIGGASGTLSLNNPTISLAGANPTLSTLTNNTLTIDAATVGSGELTLSADFNSGVNVGSVNNTPAILSVSGGIGNNAALIVNQANSGDILAASSSGTTRLRVDNTGNLIFNQASSIQTGTGNLTIDPAGSLILTDFTNCSALTTSGTTLTCGTADGGSNWNVLSGAISPKLANTLDLLIGGSATTSAKFAVTGINGGATPFASVSATLASGGNGNGITLGGDSTIQSLRNSTLTLGGTTTGNIVISPLGGGVGSLLTVNAITATLNGTTTLNASSLASIDSAAALAIDATSLTLGGGAAATITTLSDDNLTLTPQGSGNLLLTGDFDSQVLIGATGATTEFPLLVRSGIGNNAAVAIDNLNSGDLFTASAAGTTRFTINNAGSALFNGVTTDITTTANETLTLNPGGTGDIVLTTTNTGTGAIQLNVNGTGGDLDINVNDAVTIDAASLAVTLAAGTTDFTINGLDADSNLVLSGATFTTCSALTMVSNVLTCGTADGSSNWDVINGTIQPKLASTLDLLIGGTSSTSARFHAFANNPLTGGTIPSASISGRTSAATLIVDNSNSGMVGDIFAASSSGLNRFVISQNGNVGIGNSLPTERLDIAGNATASGSLSLGGVFQAGVLGGTVAYNRLGYAVTNHGLNASNDLFISGRLEVDGSLFIDGQLITSGTSGTVGWFQRNNGALAPTNITDDLLLGSVSTASARFAVFNMTGPGTPTASISAVSNGTGLSLGGDGVIQSVRNNTLTLGGATTGNLLFSPLNGTGFSQFGGKVGINTANPLATLDVRSNSGTLASASISGRTSFAGLVVDNSGSGDLFAASSSGKTRFVIAQNGNVGIGNLARPPQYGLDVSTKSAAFNSEQDASLGQWNTTTSLPANRSGPGSVFVNGYIYVMGGDNGSSPQQTVYYANVNANGTVGQWKEDTNPLPAGRYLFPGISVNGYIYIIGGSNGTAVSTVYYTKVNADGSLTPWQTTTSLPATPAPSGARQEYAGFTANGYVYVVGGNDTDFTVRAEIFYARVNPNGTLGAWLQNGTDFPTVIKNQSIVAVNGFMYSVGGNDNSARVDEVYYGKINPDGSISGFVTMNNVLPVATANHSLIAANGNLYLLGGDTAGGDQSAVYYAPVRGDGSVGTWTRNSTNITAARRQFGSVIANGYIYVIGGNSGGEQANVYYASTARVSMLASLDLIGLTNRGLSSTSGELGMGSLGGSIFAGNIFSNANLEVIGATKLWGPTFINNSLTAQSLYLSDGIGTQPIASLSGNTAFAGLLVDNSGRGDIFTASSSGLSRFTIKQNGTIQLSTPYTTCGALTTVAGLLTCNASAGGSNWDVVNGVITPKFASTVDLLIGGNSSTSARFHAYGNNPLTGGTIPSASISGKTSAATLIVDNSGVGDIFTASSSGLTRFTITQAGMTIVDGPLRARQIGASNNRADFFVSGGQLAINAVDDQNGNFLDFYTQSKTLQLNVGTTGSTLGMYINANGLIGMGALTSSNGLPPFPLLATLDVRTRNGTLSTASVSGQTSFAGLVVDNSGVGDIFTASSSGLTRFTILQNGSVTIGSIPISNIKLYVSTPNFGERIARFRDDGYTADATFVANAPNAMMLRGGGGDSLNLAANDSSTPHFTIDATGKIGIGTTSPLAALDIRANAGHQPTASVSGITSGAGLLVDNSGSGDLFTASSSGLNRFVVKQNGFVGIGTTLPLAMLDVAGAASISGNLTLYGGARTIETTSKNSLTLGSATTGNILLGNTGFTTCTALTSVSGILTCGTADGGSNWDVINGTIQPKLASTLDLLIGGTSSTSARFHAFANNPLTGGTIPSASISGRTSAATLIVDNSGVGDIFTASSSGLSRFTLLQNGTIRMNSYNVAGGIFFADSTGLLQQAGGGSGTDCLKGGTTPSWSSCAAGAGSNWDVSTVNGTISPKLGATLDFLLGGSATNSSLTNFAKFAVLNIAGTINTPTASLSAGLAGGAYLTATGMLQTTANQTLTIGGDTTGNILINPQSVNRVGIGTFTPLADLHINGGPGTNATTSISAQTSFAAMVVNNSGSGDIFTASSGGQSRFVIQQNGNVGIGTNLPSEKLTVAGNIMLETKPNATFAEQTTWTKVSQTTAGTIGAPPNANTLIASISASAVYNGSLYVGTYGQASGSAEIYRHNVGSSGTSWTRVSHPTESGRVGVTSSTSNIGSISAMSVFDGRLYVGTSKMTQAEVYRYEGGTSWTKVSSAIAGTIKPGGTSGLDGVSSLAVFQGRLYAGTRDVSGAQLYRYDGGSNGWSLINATQGTFIGTNTAGVSAISSMAVYNGFLYLGMEKPGDADVVRYLGGGNGGTAGAFLAVNALTATGSYNLDGTSVTLVDSVPVMTVYNGALIIGLKKNNGADIYAMTGVMQGETQINVFTRLNSAAGQMTSSGTPNIDAVASMTVYNGNLYVGTYEPNSAEIYRYTGGDQRFLKVSGTAGTVGNGATVGIGAVTMLTPVNGDLYAGTYEPGRAEVYKLTDVSIDRSYALQFHAAPQIAGGEQNSIPNEASIYYVASASANLGSAAANTGALVFSHGIQTRNGSYDVAEDYPTRDDSLEAGDVVAIDKNERGFVKKSESAYDAMMGVYSEKPGFRLTQDASEINGGRAVPVALVGRVPVKVTTENGSIKSGDYLTMSTTPGHAMKATRAGQIIGRSLEGFDPQNGEDGTGLIDCPEATPLTRTCGKVMLYVSSTWYDPDVYLTSTGNINVFEKEGAPPIDGTSLFGVKDADGQEVSRVGLFSEATIGNLQVGNIDVQKLTIAGQDINSRLTGLEDTASTTAQLGTQVANLQSRMVSLSDRIASLEANIQFASLTSPFSFGASSSAELSLDKIDANDIAVSGTLSVLGRTLLSDVGITGNINMGVLSITGLDSNGYAAINSTSGPLKLQSNGLNGLDILNGKVTVSGAGDVNIKETLTAKVIKTTKLNIVEDPTATNSATLSASAGSVVIQTGETSLDIDTTALTANSLIFVTPDQPVIIGAKKKDTNTFTIKLQSPAATNVKVNWWIVN